MGTAHWRVMGSARHDVVGLSALPGSGPSGAMGGAEAPHHPEEEMSLKSAEEAYDLTESFHDAGELTRCSLHA